MCLDFPGHGLSDHKSYDYSPIMNDYVYYVHELICHLSKVGKEGITTTNTTANTTTIITEESKTIEPITLIGHSMGSGVGISYASAFPENVKRFIMLEGYGPMSQKADQSNKVLRRAIEVKYKHAGVNKEKNTSSKNPRVYAMKEDAIRTRVKTATISPGNQYISEYGAKQLVERATVETTGGYKFRHDSRLHNPSFMVNTPEQVEQIVRSVKCKTLIIKAEDGWPVAGGTQEISEKMGMFGDGVGRLVEVKGSHHAHLDPDNFGEVEKKVLEFLTEEDNEEIDGEATSSKKAKL